MVDTHLVSSLQRTPVPRTYLEELEGYTSLEPPLTKAIPPHQIGVERAARPTRLPFNQTNLGRSSASWMVLV